MYIIKLEINYKIYSHFSNAPRKYEPQCSMVVDPDHGRHDYHIKSIL